MAEGQGRSSGQGVKLLYIRDYLYSEATRANPKNAKQIASFLDRRGISAVPKTIYNDILQLKEKFGVPVEYDNRKHGYYISKPIFEPFELQLLLDGIRSNPLISDKEVEGISHKLIAMADVDAKRMIFDAKESRKRWDKNEQYVQNVGKFYQAIAENRKIAFRYTTNSSNPSEPPMYLFRGEHIVFSPYQIYNEGKYYKVYGYDTKRDTMLSFFLDYCCDVTNPLPEYRDGEEAYKQSPVPRRKIITTKKKKPVDVKLLCRRYCTDSIYEQFGHTMIIPADEESVSVTVRTPIDREFFGWVCKHRDDMEILEPASVRRRFEEFVDDILNQYSELVIKRIPKKRGREAEASPPVDYE